jgi:very-short-patch-repair endonuclease
MTDSELGLLAAGQQGVFARDEAIAAGLSRDQLIDRVNRGRYIRLYPGVYAIAGAPRTDRQRLAGVARSFPQLAAVSHQTAAEMWGLTRRGIRTLEVVTTRWDRVQRPGVRVHESLDLIDADVVEIDGVPVTTAVRTVVDLGASHRWSVESALEEGIRRGLFGLDEVEAFVRRVARRGRRGVGVIRPLLESRRRWDSATESALEDCFRRLIAASGLPQPVLQHEIRNDVGRLISRVDFAYPDYGLAIELDSEAYHMDRLTFRGDRRKQNQASVLGWTVLRYTWWDLHERPSQVEREIRAALRAALRSRPTEPL